MRKVFGNETSSDVIIASVAFAIISFFYIYSLATYLKIDVWELNGRVSYHYYFELYLWNKIADHLVILLSTALWMVCSLRLKKRFAIAFIYVAAAVLASLFNLDTIQNILALLSLPLILVLYSINNAISKKFLKSDRNLVINYLAIIGIGIGMMSVVVSLKDLYFTPDEANLLRNIAHEIYLIFSSSSPIFLILLILCLPVRIIVDYVNGVISKGRNILTERFLLHPIRIKLLTKIALLSGFMLLSSLMVIIPHQSVVNPDNKDVGVDTKIYVQEIGIMNNSTSVEELLRKTFVTIQHGDRPMTLLFFLTISKILSSHNLSIVFDYVPILLSPLIVLSVYALTRQLTSNDIASLLSAFITGVSFHTLVGIYAGSYANLLALIVGYLSVAFLFRCLKELNKFNVSLYLILLVAVLLTHIYTWSILSIVTGVFLLLMLLLRYYERRTVIVLLMVLSLSVLLDIVRTLITGAASGTSYAISPPYGTIVQLGPELYSTRWSTIVDTTLSFFGSLFGNAIIFGLGLYWLIRSKIREPSTIFLLVFLSVGMIPLFFGNWILQARVFYNIPFQIPAAIALTYMYQRKGGFLIVIATCVWLIVMAISAVSNFYFISPS